jgi:ParB family chromosome partitioning protein
MGNIVKEKNHQTKRKVALGRGLDSLIPVSEASQGTDPGYFECDIDRIRPNAYQPRRHFPEAELMELSRSIAEQGILQPLVVRSSENGYELIAGERRLRAARIAGLRKVPVVLREAGDTEALQMSIVENIQRENLNPIEEAEAYHRLIVEFGLTQEQAADRVGRSRPAVANIIRLRHLPQNIKDSIQEGVLSMGHARALLSTDTTVQQHAAWKEIVSKGLSVRQTESLVKRLKEKKKAAGQAPDSEDRYLSDVADELSRRFGTRVRIQRKGKNGSVEIDFYGNDDLDRLIQLFNKMF